MIRIEVRTILEFAQIFGQDRFEVTLAEGRTVENLLEELINTWGDELASSLFEPDRFKLLPHIGLMVNGRSISLLDNMETVLQDGDQVLILPPVGGG